MPPPHNPLGTRTPEPQVRAAGGQSSHQSLALRDTDSPHITNNTARTRQWLVRERSGHSMETTSLKGSPGLIMVPNPPGSLRLGKTFNTTVSPPDRRTRCDTREGGRTCGQGSAQSSDHRDEVTHHAGARDCWDHGGSVGLLQPPPAFSSAMPRSCRGQGQGHSSAENCLPGTTANLPLP